MTRHRREQREIDMYPAPPEPTAPPNLYFGEPYAEIKQTGRFWYHVTVSHGVMNIGFWHVLGKHRAERFARRKLLAHQRRLARKATYTVKEVRLHD